MKQFDDRHDGPKARRSTRTSPIRRDGRGGRHLLTIAAVVAIIVPSLVMGRCSSGSREDRLLSEALTEVRAAQNIAQAAVDSGKYWRSEAESATAAATALQAELAAVTADRDLWRLRAEDATETVAGSVSP